ncbi:unnamed protein product [Cuscuta epithymum]|uniref:Uncharacterized protein n=1 Tax=Cuscuta epithymum TaxID=186058 RepID=A0AAV0D688_9ASTE|nr:unnamed protein product [Cuscuta epithymum]
MMYYPGSQQDKLDSSFIAEQSWGATEAASIVRSEFTRYPELLDLQFTDEDILEMDDLLGTGPVQFPQLREHDEFDMFNDSDLFLGDFTSNNQIVNPSQHQRPLENGFVGQSPNSVPTSGNEMWNFGANNCIHNSTEGYKGTMPLPVTGAEYAGVSTNIASKHTRIRRANRMKGLKHGWLSHYDRLWKRYLQPLHQPLRA